MRETVRYWLKIAPRSGAYLEILVGTFHVYIFKSVQNLA